MVLKIKELRSDKGLSQSELAAGVGVSQTVVCNWENEVALPRTRDLPMLAAVLGVGIGDLFVEVPDQAVNT